MSRDQVVFENTEAPSGEVFSEWLRFVLQFGEADHMQIGGRGYRYWGLLMVQVFTKKGIGVARGVELADAVALLYRDQSLSGNIFGIPTITKVPGSKNDWFQVQVSAPFYFNEVLP